MTVRVYQSTDASAPVLTGVAGSLIALLDACLVTGYGAKTAAGWSKPYTSGANRAVFRMATGSGRTGHYLNVDDNATTTAMEAYMTGFQTMTAYNTGTGQFPVAGQNNQGSAPAGAVVARKSATASAVARAWTIVADESCFYLFVQTGDNLNVDSRVVLSFFFGDIFSYATTDLYKSLIIGRNFNNSGSSAYECFTSLNGYIGNNTVAGHFMAAQQSGLSPSLLVGKHTDTAKLGALAAGTTQGQTSAAGGSGNSFGRFNDSTPNLQYPNPTDGALVLAPVWVHHPTYTLRGYMKGLWAFMQRNPVSPFDTFSGSGALAGKTFMAIPLLNSWLVTGDYALVAIETSDTWS